MSRELAFPIQKSIYLILNIIAHDIIHDYGSVANPSRWIKSKNMIKQFLPTNLTFSNPSSVLSGGEKRFKNEYGTVTETETIQEDTNKNPNEITLQLRQPGTRRIVRGNLNSINQPVPSIEDPVILEEEINEFVTDLKTTMIFTFFSHYMFYYKNSNGLMTTLFTDLLLVPEDVNDELKDVFEAIKNKFIGYCGLLSLSAPQYINLRDIEDELPYRYYRYYLDVLCLFFNNTKAVEQSIFENVDYNFPFYSTLMTPLLNRKRAQEGGKPREPELNEEASNALINMVNSALESGEINGRLDRMNEIFNRSLAGISTIEEFNEYQELRKGIIEIFQQIFLNPDFNQTKKAGSLYGNFKLFPVLSTGRALRQTIFDLVGNFKDIIKSSIYDYYQVILQAEKERELIALRQERETSRQAEAEKREQKKQEKKDLNDSKTESLTSEERDVRSQFVKWISRSGLFLLGICDNQGNINPTMNSLSADDELRLEINILLYFAQWTSNSQWEKIKTATLDDVLINYYKDYTGTNKKYSLSENQSNSGRYVCPENIKRYVVNNASPLPDDLKDRTFCPYSSIIDGMQQCSWDSSETQSTIERGDMDFIIKNLGDRDYPENAMYYNGKLELEDNNEITLSMQVQTSRGIIIGNRKTTGINSDDLTAANVMKNTLSNIIDYVLSKDLNMQAKIFTGGDIFSNLFQLFSKVEMGGFNIIYSEILFKGVGDLFQEINSVCKFGGYTMTNYQAADNIENYKNTSKKGNQIRLFTANDRPSGTRFMFMLRNGRPQDINLLAMGGYFSKNEQLVTKIEGSKPCSSIMGGSNAMGNGKTRRIRIRARGPGKRSYRNNKAME